MTGTTPRVIVIPPKPELVRSKAVQRQLRVAAYCRVFTDDEEQLTSYEAQQAYYTDKIMTNPQWTMAGIFADEGITGTSAQKRPEFQRMIRRCRQKKIDLVLVKSISRFARNTVDCLNYIRALRTLGIAVIFEKENINTLETDSEMLITMMGAFAQAESESMSANIVWGKRQAMREGKTNVQFQHLYGYGQGEDGKPRIVPEQAAVVEHIYDSFLAGRSIRMIKKELEGQGVLTAKGGTAWSEAAIRGILKNEKYCGDVLMQKTYTQDCISKKQLRNIGQLPMYLVQDNHQGIITRDRFNQAKAEFARRNAGRAPSQKLAPTGRSCYSAKYALTERLVCGECGTLYRRCVWVKKGQRFAVWRCASRIDYGTKYCHDSPTLREEPLQAAILAAINTVMSQQEALVGQIEGAMRMELIPFPGAMSISDIDRRLEELEKEFHGLFADSQDGGFMKHAEEFKRISADMAALKEQRARLLEQQNSDSAASQRIANAMEILKTGDAAVQWEESTIRQLVDTVKVLSANRIKIYLHGGIEIEQTIGEEQ